MIWFSVRAANVEGRRRRSRIVCLARSRRGGGENCGARRTIPTRLARGPLNLLTDGAVPNGLGTPATEVRSARPPREWPVGGPRSTGVPNLRIAQVGVGTRGPYSVSSSSTSGLRALGCQVLSGLYSVIAAASFSVSSPRSFSNTMPVLLTMNVLMPGVAVARRPGDARVPAGHQALRVDVALPASRRVRALRGQDLVVVAVERLGLVAARAVAPLLGFGDETRRTGSLPRLPSVSQ